MSYTIKYGIVERNIDIAQNLYNDYYYKNGIMYIPKGDIKRSFISGDPVHGILKSIFIYLNNMFVAEYDSQYEIFVDTVNKNIYSNNVPDNLDMQFVCPLTVLSDIHKELKLDYGSLNDEYHEQLMAVTFIKGHEKILEIGANIGRNTLVLAHIINMVGNTDMVSLECNKNICLQLEHNRTINDAKFHIENSALSKRPLVQKGWDTIPLTSNIIPEGYTRVDIIDFVSLKNKYNIDFDTLVLDCEGAFYWILMDMPEILDSVRLIMMENDYTDIKHKQFIDNTLSNNGFEVIYNMPGGWGVCFECFYQVWERRTI